MTEKESSKRHVLCPECEGDGYFERIVGEDHSGMGGISPITVEVRCEDCGGDGLKGCAWCGDTPAFLHDPSCDAECLSCREQLLEDQGDPDTGQGVGRDTPQPTQEVGVG